MKALGLLPYLLLLCPLLLVILGYAKRHRFYKRITGRGKANRAAKGGEGSDAEG